MSIRAIALLLVAGLVFLDTIGKGMLPPAVNTALTLLLVLGIVLLVVRAAHEYRYEDESDPGMKVWAALGWKLPAIVLVLACVGVTLTAVRWAWRSRADFDVLGILWLLQNMPGVGLITLFGMLAVFAFVVMLRALVATRFHQR